MPTVADILKEHVILDIESFDRLYLNGYVPILQTERQLTYFLTQHLSNNIASPALLGKMTTDFVKRVEEFIRDENIPRIEFKKKQSKDQIANQLRKKDPRRDVVVFVGIAQEKQQTFKGKKNTDNKGFITFSYSRQTAFVKHYYFYIDDSNFGPCFIKIGTYAPFPIRVCLNGHEWAKRQLEKEKIPYESLDNGFLSCQRPEALQKICDQLGPQQIDRFFRKWIQRLPFPLTRKNITTGYRHQLSVCQVEFSRTQVFDRPVRGREFLLEAGFWILDTGFALKFHPVSGIQHLVSSKTLDGLIVFNSFLIARLSNLPLESFALALLLTACYPASTLTTNRWI